MPLNLTSKDFADGDYLAGKHLREQLIQAFGVLKCGAIFSVDLSKSGV
jgi:hypothetical protein